MGISPWPVMKMIGISRFAAASSRLKIKAASSRQSDVEHQANGTIRRVGLKKLGDGRKQLSIQAERSQQTLNRGPQRRIIVDDQDGSVRVKHRCAHDQQVTQVSLCLGSQVSRGCSAVILVPTGGREQSHSPSGDARGP